MKTLKLAVVALSLGFFAASCGNTETTNNDVDTTVVAPTEAPVEAPVAAPDTTMPAPAADTTTPAPAAH